MLFLTVCQFVGKSSTLELLWESKKNVNISLKRTSKPFDGEYDLFMPLINKYFKILNKLQAHLCNINNILVVCYAYSIQQNFHLDSRYKNVISKRL